MWFGISTEKRMVPSLPIPLCSSDLSTSVNELLAIFPIVKLLILYTLLYKINHPRRRIGLNFVGGIFLSCFFTCSLRCSPCASKVDRALRASRWTSRAAL
eukprot:SAG22_NODE_436_length_10519_cov_21.912188_13_plen_100_part_00